MKEHPPATLIDLLARLRLAAVAEVRGVSGRVRRLAGGLPRFESLWVDALAQAGLLTPWQAAEINAGRGEALKIGPFVVYEPLAALGYATVFRAREIEGRGFVRLSVAGRAVDRDDAERRLALLARQAGELDQSPLVPLRRHGLDGELLWAASDYFAGRTARQWMIEHGRFPPATVLEIARQMLAGLAACERVGAPHADVGAAQLWFDKLGQVRLPEPGLRGVLRPTEGYGQIDLPPEAYDYLAPERAAEGLLPDSRGELYACGAVWWHLLTGRPPLGGATALAKLRAAQAAKLPDIRHLAPDTPEPLASAVMACLMREPERRPASLAALAAALGEPTLAGQKRLAKLLRPRSPHRIGAAITFRAWRRSAHASTWAAGAAGAILALAIIAWPAVPGWFEQSAAVPPPRVKRVAAKSTRPQAATVAVLPDEKEEEEQNELPSTSSPAAAVVPAAWQEPENNVLALSADGPKLDWARLSPGLTVRGDAERRPIVEAPFEGLVIEATDVTFENVDFAARQPLSPGAALLTLRGLKTTFRGCSFQAAAETAPSDAPTALAWKLRVDPAVANADLSTGELEISDSVFYRVAAAVSCRLAGGMVFRLENVLHLGAAPAVRVDRFPEADEVLALALSHVTLRGAKSLIEVGCDRLPASPGHLRVQADGCAFILPSAAALVVFQGESRPGPLLQALRWSGQGSVLSTRSRLAIWRMPEGRMLAAADDAAPIEGVVRGEVGFAGAAEDGPAGSRIVRWQAPLHSSQPPGIDDSLLHLPAD